MMNDSFVTMKKGLKTRVFYVFSDCTYRAWVEKSWSAVADDFAETYIKLRDAGWEEA